MKENGSTKTSLNLMWKDFIGCFQLISFKLLLGTKESEFTVYHHSHVKVLFHFKEP